MTDEIEQDIPDEVITSETPQEEVTATETDTVEETDEQKNERVQREAAERAEKRSRGIQKRIDELTADKHSERKRADELAVQNARILALLEERKQPTQQQLSREQYESDADYVLALARAEAEKIAETKVSKLLAEQNEKFERQTQEQKEAATHKRFTEKVIEVKKQLPDFDEVVEDWQPNIPLSVSQTIVQLEDGPLIAYHLAKNPSLEAKFNSQPEYMHGVILGQLIATIKGNQVTKTSAPGKVVSATSSGNANEPPSDPDKYYEWAKKHMR